MILLANHEGRCLGFGEKTWQVSKTCLFVKEAFFWITSPGGHMVIQSMGNQSSQPISNCSWLVEISNGGHWTLYKVYQSWTFGNHCHPKCPKFVWKTILCQFGISKVLILDNDTQFSIDNFKKFCEALHIK